MNTQEVCAATEWSRRDRDLPGTGSDSLLLVPLDADADAALQKALSSENLAFTRHSLFYELPNACPHFDTLRQQLARCLPDVLQNRVKGAFIEDALSPEALLPALIRAEPLPIFFERNDLRWAARALTEGWLYSVFHPVLDAADGQVFGYEALIRARNPQTEEIIPPRQLLYACEKINLQHQFDQAARMQALRDAAALPRTGARFFINFHPCSLYDPAISLQTTLDIAHQSQIAASQLVFEVVETEQIEDRALLSGILRQYRQRGVGVALDDMGSSSDTLSYLAELMPDYVKIDSELVYEATRRASARHALQAMVELAKRLNMKVIAKGIETEAQLHACRQAGVDFMQGFLFAHPANPPQSVSPSLFATGAAHRAA